MPRKLTFKEFIEKSKLIHIDKYIYDKVNYINSYTKIIITCKKHGDFFQNPKNHLRGHGCIQCKNFENRNKYQMSLKDFIEEINKINKYYKKNEK